MGRGWAPGVQYIASGAAKHRMHPAAFNAILFAVAVFVAWGRFGPYGV